MKLTGKKFRLLVFVVILLIVSIICFYENYKLNNDGHTEKATNTTVEITPQTLEYVKETEIKVEPLTVTKKTLPTKSTSTSKKKNDVKVKINKDDEYLLAKIAMAEAEGQSTKGKALAICVVLNRTKSNKFPDTVHDVIYEPKQFSPISNGRFDSVEPNKDCYKALEMVKSGWDESNGALYFESCEGESWHSRNLQLLFKVGCHRFYK